MKIALLAIIFIINIKPTFSARNNGEDFNNQTPTYESILGFYKKYAKTNNAEINENYKKIAKWTRENLSEDISSKELYQGLNKLGKKVISENELGAEEYKKLTKWSQKNFKKVKNLPKIKSTWKWANKTAKKNWDQRFKIKDAARVAKVFFSKDSEDYPGNLIGRSARHWKKVMKSDFMTEDFKDFNFIKRQLRKLPDDFIQVSDIFIEEVESIKIDRHEAKSNVEKAAITVLRSMWLLTKEGAYLFIALPTKLALSKYRHNNKSCVERNFTWHGFFDDVFRCRSFSHGDIIAPGAVMLSSVADIAILRVAGNGMIYSVAHNYYFWPGDISSGQLCRPWTCNGGRLCWTNRWYCLRAIWAKSSRSYRYRSRSCRDNCIHRFKGIHRYIGVPIASGFAYIGYSTYVGLTEGPKKVAVGSTSLAAAIGLTAWNALKTLSKVPSDLTGIERYKYYFNTYFSPEREKQFLQIYEIFFPLAPQIVTMVFL